jgi:hypothetical protein
MLVNGTIYDVRESCIFNQKPPRGSYIIYRVYRTRKSIKNRNHANKKLDTIIHPTAEDNRAYTRFQH